MEVEGQVQAGPGRAWWFTQGSAQQAATATLAGEVTFSEPAGQWGGSRDGAAPWD